MILGPRVRFSVHPDPALFSHPDPMGAWSLLERKIPGAEVEGWVGSWRRTDRIQDPSGVSHWRVTTALHSAWRVPQELPGRILGGEEVDCEGVYPTVFSTHRDWLMEAAQPFLHAAVERGELLPETLNRALPFQVAFAGWCLTRPWAMLTARPGGGKTLAALLALLTLPFPQPVLVVCPAAARKEWRTGGRRARRMLSSVEKFTRLETHVILPEAERGKGYENLEEYQERMRREGKRAVVVVGMEALPDHVNALKMLSPVSVIIDELHKCGDNHRYDAIAGEDGSRFFQTARSEGGGMRRSVALMHVSRFPSIRNRIGLSGTPLDDGKTRRLWAPLDLLSPGGFGAYGKAFRHRYCGFRLDENGYPDDSSSTHIADDLKLRCSFLLFDVPREESHRGRKLRIEVDYLTGGQLGQPDAMVREIRKLQKEAASGGVTSRMALREANLAYACSMKRGVVIGRAKEFLEGGMKVMIFVSRRAMAESWGEALRKTGVEGWVAHGGIGPAECDRVVDLYATASGGVWLVGTWDAVGESKNGMQGTHLGVVAQLPVKPSQWIQGVGRWDRLDGVGTIVWVPVAEGTQDDAEVQRLVRKFGPITQFLESPELREAADALEGLDDAALEESVIGKLMQGSGSYSEDA